MLFRSKTGQMDLPQRNVKQAFIGIVYNAQQSGAVQCACVGQWKERKDGRLIYEHNIYMYMKEHSGLGVSIGFPQLSPFSNTMTLYAPGTYERQNREGECNYHLHQN